MKILLSYPQVVGAVIRNLRLNSSRPTQEMFADALGMSGSGWSRVELGKTTINMAQLRKASRLLGTTCAEIILGADKAAVGIERQGIVVLDEAPPLRENSRGLFVFDVPAGSVFLEGAQPVVDEAIARMLQ